MLYIGMRLACEGLGVFASGVAAGLVGSASAWIAVFLMSWCKLCCAAHLANLRESS